jgi:large subunit ribosomal protein L25
MKQAIPLTVTGRDLLKNVKHLRKEGTVPGVIYGNATNTPVQCSSKEFHHVFAKAGENTLVDVQMGEKKIPCLIHAVSYIPKSGAYEHIDFYAVDMSKKVTTHVPINFEGESPAVKNEGGVLLTVRSELEVTCLPIDLPSHFTVDLSKLEKLRDSFMVSDLVVPKNVVITESPETSIVIVQEPRKEEVIEPVVSAVGAPSADGTAAPTADGATAPAAGAPAADAGGKKK